MTSIVLSATRTLILFVSAITNIQDLRCEVILSYSLLKEEPVQDKNVCNGYIITEIQAEQSSGVWDIKSYAGAAPYFGCSWFESQGHDSDLNEDCTLCFPDSETSVVLPSPLVPDVMTSLPDALTCFECKYSESCPDNLTHKDKLHWHFFLLFMF